jgi:hypothetical protein
LKKAPRILFGVNSQAPGDSCERERGNIHQEVEPLGIECSCTAVRCAEEKHRSSRFMDRLVIWVVLTGNKSLKRVIAKDIGDMGRIGGLL